MKATGFYYDEMCFWHSAGNYAQLLPVGGWVQPPAGVSHAESPESKRRMKNLMDVSGLSARLMLSGAATASQEALERIHPEEYLRRLSAMSEAGGGLLAPGAPVGPHTFEAAKMSAGLAMEAVDAVLSKKLSNAYALSRPPGHHCLADQAMGFCYLANIAIAIEHARSKWGIQRIAVIDWDVHHGNGTQSIFYERDDVLTLSLHQHGAFPRGYSGEHERGKGAGEGFNYNVPLMPGSGHLTYLYAVNRIVRPALDKFRPQLIIVACGFDANAVDPLGRMLLHSDSYRAMTESIKACAEHLCDGHMVMVHEGGYAEAYVPFCGLAVMEALSGVRTDVQDPMLSFIEAQQPDEQLVAFQCARIDQLAEAFGLSTTNNV